MDEITNDWHSDFYAAIREIFKNEKDKIEIIQEQYLSKEPLRIDVIVVKKNDDYGIDKQIAKIFKKYNIIEYKSPEDYVSIDDYFKGLGYAYIYKSIMNDYEKTNKKVNDIKIEEVTLSFVSNSYPRRLTKFLKEYGINVEKSDDGIYYIKGEWISIQLVVLKELKNVKENYPVILLSDNVYFGEAFEELLKSINDVKDKDEKIRLLEAAFRVNIKKAVEVFKMYSDRVNEETQEYIIKTLKEANLKIYTEEELKEREEKGIEKGIGKTLIRLLTRKFGDISSDYKKKIENANEHTLTEIVDHIFEINKIEDLDEYLK